MIPVKNKRLFTFLCALLGLVLCSLLGEALLQTWASPRPLSRLLHILTALFLTSALTLLGLFVRKILRGQQAAHWEEIRGMRREADKALLRYKNLLEGAGDAIFIIDPESGLLGEMNRKGTELLGYSMEEMGTLSGSELIPKGELAKYRSLVRRVKRRGSAASDGITFRRKDGGTFLGAVRARLIDLGDEQVVQVSIRDVTVRSRAEKEVRQRNRELSILNNLIAGANDDLQLQTVLDVTLRETIEVFGAEGGGIHLLEPDGESLVLSATHAVSEGLRAKIERTALHGEHPCQLVTNRRCHSLANLSSGRCHMARAAAADGWHTFAAAPLLAKNRLIGTMHIMTRLERQFTPEELRFFSTIGKQMGILIEHARLFEELHRQAEELLRSHRLLERNSHQLAVSKKRLNKNLALVERANMELERLDRMKSHFLGMISHEFRTPLTSIISGTQYLLAARESDLENEERRVLEMVHSGGARLLEILTDLLKVARLEAKSISITKNPLKLAQVFEMVLERLEPLVRERQQRIVLGDLESVPYFHGDREYLEEVFTHLLENSVKFTPNGGTISVAASMADRKALEGKRDILSRFHGAFLERMGENHYLQVEIRDSGIGIDFGEQVNIFDKFYEVGDIRHHSSGRHKFQGKGAGLGLAIVKGMVEAHDGMVWVESPGIDLTVDAGSAFFILLPLEEGTRQSAFSFMEAHAFAPPPLPGTEPAPEET